MNTPTYKLPAEWVKQQQILLTWPHQRTDWGTQLTAIDAVYKELAKHISLYEQVTIICYDEEHKLHVQNILRREPLVNLNAIQCVCIPTNDVFIRDYGPLTVFADSVQKYYLDFLFNAWGEKYDFTYDKKVTENLYQQNILTNGKLLAINFVLEGGSIEIDDRGNLLTTTRCLLHQARNAGYKQEDIDQFLKNYLGVKNVLWLHHGELIGDDTDSHIDNLARFTPANAILYTTCTNPQDPHYAPLKAMEAELQQMNQEKNLQLELFPLPLPEPVFDASGSRLPASYANFLIINGAVLVPIYGDKKTDLFAQEQIAHCFPDRKIIPILSRALVEQYGSIHCASIQIPE